VPTSTVPHFSQAGCPSCRPTNSVKALKATSTFGLCDWLQQLCLMNILVHAHKYNNDIKTAATYAYFTAAIILSQRVCTSAIK